MQRGEQAAEQARRAYLLADDIPGAARSEFELAYAFDRQSRPDKCLQAIAMLSELLRGKNYHWLATQLRLESASCKAMMAQFDSAWESAAEAAKIAQTNGYQTLALRALGFQASLHTREGRLRQSWSANVAGLTSFWDAAFSSLRGWQFYSEIEAAADQASQPNVSAFAVHEELAMLAQTNYTYLTAMAHFRLGATLAGIGSDAESAGEIRKSYELLSQLPPSSSTNLYKSFCEIALATLAIRRGSRQDAIEHLRRVGPSIPRTGNVHLYLRYVNAYAEMARMDGDFREEERFRAKAVSVSTKGFETLRSESDRWDWWRETNPSFRRLLELHAQRPHDSEQLLAEWESYRNYQTFGGLPAGSSHDAKTTLHLRIARLHRPVLVYAVLPQELIAWVVANGGVQEFKIPITQPHLVKAVKDFYDLCSSPDSSLAKVKEAGLRLYQWILLPLEKGNGTLAANGEVLIEADGILGLVPWSALTMENGKYFGAMHTVINIPGVLSGGAIRKAPGGERTLVAYPGPVTLQEEVFPPLPGAEREAEFVAAYPGTTYLKYEQATGEHILAELLRSSVFYFAGHAVERERGGELVVQGRNGGDILSASRLHGLTLPRTRLVVLSACSTALAEGDVSRNPDGLVWAFLEAGAGEVVASRWNVDAAQTATLMKNFYSRLLAASSPPAALSAAQQAAFSQVGFHPYYWASFQAFSNAN